MAHSDPIETDVDIGIETDGESEVEDINQDCLDQYEFAINEQIGCRIYNGVLIEKKQNILDTIAHYSSMVQKKRMSPLKFNTSNTKGKILNMDFKDESIIKTLNLSSEHRITKVGCNQEEIYIFPNEYVGYNIAHIIDIVKNSFNEKYRTRIRCNCQNLLDHRDYICAEYDIIKAKIDQVKKSDLINRIDKYLKTRKHRAKEMTDKLMKICKKMMVYNFHQEIMNAINIKGLSELFSAIGQNPQFERDQTVQVAKELFARVGRLLEFFKSYVAKCKCIKQPYDWNKPLQLKIVSADSQEVDKQKPKKQIGRKKYSKNNIHGCGKYFNCQITFDIYYDIIKKLYKIKIFRNGNFQASGVKSSEMLDIITPLETLCTYLTRELHHPISVSYIISISRVYVCNILDYIDPKTTLWGSPLTTHIFLDKLVMCCRKEKQNLYMSAGDMISMRKCMAGLGEQISDCIMDYLSYTSQHISEIIYDSEMNSGHMIIKFHRPIPNKPDKKITVKIQYRGIISFNGCNSELEATELYHWLEYIFDKYWQQVMFIPTNIENMEYISDDGYHSLYDDDPEVINRIDAKKKAAVEQ